MTSTNQVRAALKENASREMRKRIEATAPTATGIYGVSVPLLNQLARDCKAGGMVLVQELWKSGSFEERLLATKITGLVAAKTPEEALCFVTRAAAELSDWPVCDTLATQGIRPLVKTHREQLLALARRCIGMSDPWQKRFGLVLFTNYVTDKNVQPEIVAMLRTVSVAGDHYVARALQWLKRDLRKARASFP